MGGGQCTGNRLARAWVKPYEISQDTKEDLTVAIAHPYLNFAGNTEEAFGFYRSVFGGDFSGIVRFKDMPMEGVTIAKSEENRIMHISLPIGKDLFLMASDTLESLGQKLVQGNNFYICLSPDSRGEADRLFTALSAGGEVEMPIADAPWGDYFGSFKDKYGVQWMVNYSSKKSS
jgi:PhnB protein